MSTPTRGRRSRAASVEPTTETVQETPVTEATEADSSTLNVDTDAETVVDGQPEAKRPGRKPMDEAERQKRATFRACQKATELLREHGFKVAEPEGWEDPESERLRAAAVRALDALRAAGIDPTTVTDGVAPTAS
jgi:hypothetical protein